MQILKTEYKRGLKATIGEQFDLKYKRQPTNIYAYGTIILLTLNKLFAEFIKTLVPHSLSTQASKESSRNDNTIIRRTDWSVGGDFIHIHL